MHHRRAKPLCTDPLWEGRADCRHCPIRSQVLFADVPDVFFEHVLVPIDNLRYAQKAVIYVPNDTGRAIYTIRHGAVKLQQTLANKMSRVVRVLKIGDVFGLEALLDHPYAHTAVALHALDLCKIPVEVVHTLNGSQSPLYIELLKRWQRNLDQADAFITQLSTGTSKVRMARLLLLLDGQSGVPQGTSLSRENMGQILGITTETASRIVAGFKRRGIVREADGVLHYCDPAALQRLADGA